MYYNIKNTIFENKYYENSLKIKIYNILFFNKIIIII